MEKAGPLGTSGSVSARSGARGGRPQSQQLSSTAKPWGARFHPPTPSENAGRVSRRRSPERLSVRLLPQERGDPPTQPTQEPQPGAHRARLPHRPSRKTTSKRRALALARTPPGRSRNFSPGKGARPGTGGASLPGSGSQELAGDPSQRLQPERRRHDGRWHLPTCAAPRAPPCDSRDPTGQGSARGRLLVTTSRAEGTKRQRGERCSRGPCPAVADPTGMSSPPGSGVVGVPGRLPALTSAPRAARPARCRALRGGRSGERRLRRRLPGAGRPGGPRGREAGRRPPRAPEPRGARPGRGPWHLAPSASLGEQAERGVSQRGQEGKKLQ